jgi:hypothetical protein
MRWKAIDTAPKDGTPIDVWCIPPDDCDFEPEQGGIRLTDVWWHNASCDFKSTGWVRIVDDGFWDLVEGPPSCELGLPAWEPIYWMPLPPAPSKKERKVE